MYKINWDKLEANLIFENTVFWGIYIVPTCFTFDEKYWIYGNSRYSLTNPEEIREIQTRQITYIECHPSKNQFFIRFYTKTGVFVLN